MSKAARDTNKKIEYTDEEYDDMLMLYNMTNSSDKMYCLYKKLHPNKHPKYRRTMYQNILRYKETGTMKPVLPKADMSWDSAIKYKRKTRHVRRIMNLYTRQPTLSLREYSRRLGISSGVIRAVLLKKGIQVPTLLTWQELRKTKKSTKDEERFDLASEVIKFYERNPKKSYLKVARQFGTTIFSIKRILIEAGIVQHETVRRPCPKRHKAFNPPIEVPAAIARKCKDSISDSSDDDEAPLSVVKSLQYRQQSQNANILTDLTTANNEENKEKEEEKGKEEENDNEAENKKEEEQQKDKGKEYENLRSKDVMVLTTRLDDMVVFRQDFDIKLHPSRFFRYVEFESKPSQFAPEYENVPWDWDKPGSHRLVKKLQKINKLSSKRKTKFLEPYMPTLRSKVNFCRSKRNLKLLKICDPICCQLVRLKQKETVDLTADDDMNMDNVEDFDTFEIMDSSSDEDAIPSAKQPQETNTDITSEVSTQSNATGADSSVINPRENPRWRMVEIAIGNFNSMMNSTKEYEMKIKFVTNSTKHVETYDISLESVTCFEAIKLPDNHNTPAFASTIVQYATGTITLLFPVCCWCFRETAITEIKKSMQKLPVQLFRTRHKCSLLSCSCCRACRLIFGSNSSVEILSPDRSTELVDDTTKQHDTTEQQDCDASKQPDDDGNHRQEKPETVSAPKSSMNPMLLGLLNQQHQFPISPNNVSSLVEDMSLTSDMTLIEKALRYSQNQGDRSTKTAEPCDHKLQQGPFATDMNIVICSELNGKTSVLPFNYAEILEIDSNGTLRSYIRKNVVSTSSNILKSFRDLIDTYKPIQVFKIDTKKRVKMLEELKNMKVAPSIIKFINRDYSDRIFESANITNNNTNENIVCNVGNIHMPESKKQDMQNVKVQDGPNIQTFKTTTTTTTFKHSKVARKMQKPASNSLGLEIPKLNETIYAAPLAPHVTNYKAGKICKIPTTSYYKPNALDNDPALHTADKQYVLTKNQHRHVILVPAQLNNDDTKLTKNRSAILKKQKPVSVPALRNTTETRSTLPIINQNLEEFVHGTSTQPVRVPVSAPLPTSRKTTQNQSTLPTIINQNREPNVRGTERQENINPPVSIASFVNKSGFLDTRPNTIGLAKKNAVDDVITKFLKSNKKGEFVLNSIIEHEVSKLSKSKLKGVVDDSVWNQIDIESQIKSVPIFDPRKSKSSGGNDMTPVYIVNTIIKDIFNKFKDIELTMNSSGKVNVLMKNSLVGAPNIKIMVLLRIIRHIQSLVDTYGLRSIINRSSSKLPDANLQNQNQVPKSDFNKGLAMKTNKEIYGHALVNTPSVTSSISRSGLVKEVFDNNVDNIQKTQGRSDHNPDSISVKSEKVDDDGAIVVSSSEDDDDEDETCNLATLVEVIPKSEDSCVAVWHTKHNVSQMDITELTLAVGNKDFSNYQDQPSTSYGAVPVPFALKREDDEGRDMGTLSSQIIFTAPDMIKKEPDDNITGLPNSAVDTGFQNQPSESHGGIPVPFVIKCEDGGDQDMGTDSPQINIRKPIVIENESKDNVSELTNSVIYQPITGYQYQPITFGNNVPKLEEDLEIQPSTSYGAVPIPFVLKHEAVNDRDKGMTSSQINIQKQIAIKNESDSYTELPNSVI